MQYLSFMCFADRIRSFQLKNDSPILLNVSPKNSYQAAAKTDRNGHLGFNSQSRVAKRNQHSHAINRFQKPKPKLVINLVENLDNLLCQKVIATGKLSAHRIALNSRIFSYQL